MSVDTVSRPSFLPPQERTLRRVIELLEKGKNVDLQSPTGSGKTLMASELLRWSEEKRNGGIFYVNRKSLVSQTRKAFESAGISHGVRASEHEEGYDPLSAVQIASADTERVRVYGDNSYWHRHDCSLVIVDESHIQKGRTMQEILDDHMAGGAQVVRMSATPVGLHRTARNAELVVSGKIQEFRTCGLLVPAVVKSIEQPDLSKVKRNATGEYVMDGKKKQIFTQTIVGNVLDRWKRYNPDARPTMLYAPGKPESVWFTQQFNDAGIPWCHVDATEAYWDGKRYSLSRSLWEEILEKYKDGTFKGISSRFKCLDMETEILTSRGWRSANELEDDALIASMDVDGNVHWGRAQRKYAGMSSEWAVLRSEKGVDVCVTDDHNLLVRSPDKRCKQWKIEPANVAANRKGSFQIPVAALDDVPDMDLTDDEISVLGWMMTDGHVRDYGGWVITQSLSQPDHIHQHIKDSLSGSGLAYTIGRYVSSFGGKEFPFVTYRIGVDQVRSRKFTSLMSKDFDWSLQGLSRRQTLVLLKAINLADGSKREACSWNQKTLEIAKGNETFLSRLQMLCVLRGMRANLHRNHDCPRLYVTPDRDYATVRGATNGEKDGCNRLRIRMKRERKAYWCVQVPTGTLITRRNGKVAVVGNCREGIDLPLTYHIILATPIGSLSSYLQTVGRGLRAAHGKDHCLITDHGGNYWRHGSPNRDRDWESLWRMSEAVASKSHINDVRNGDAKEPIRCPKCEGERLVGVECPHCGHVHAKSKREVIMASGEIKTRDGGLIPKKRVRRQANTQRLWDQMYWGYRKKRLNKTFAQMEAWFVQKHGYWPPRDLNNQPTEKAHWNFPVCSVPDDYLRRGT